MNKFFVLLLLLICPCSFAYNYESTVKIPVNLAIINEIRSEKEVYESQRVNFKIKKTVSYQGKTVARYGDIVSARVKVVITSGMNGIPASIIFDDFKIAGIPENKLSGEVEVFGQDRSLWVYPLKWALTPLPPTGSLTNFIKGGKVRLKRNKVMTIYYHPEWE